MTDEPDDKHDRGDGEPPDDPVERLDLPDGPGGILTESDRVYLLHDHPEFPFLEWDGNDTQKRWRIRQKVQNALHDFQLVSSLPEKELELILDDVYAGSEDSDDLEGYTIDDFTPDSQSYRASMGWGDQYDHLLAMMTFVYRACDIVPLLTFEHLVEETVRRNVPHFRGGAPFRQGQRATNVEVEVDIDVDIEWENVLDADEIEEKLERGEPITREEVGELFLQGRIEPGDIGADDVDPDLFQASSSGKYGSDPFPGLDPSKPTPDEDWEEGLRRRLPEEMIKTVDWDEADRPEDVWEQLDEHYDDPVAYITSELYM